MRHDRRRPAGDSDAGGPDAGGTALLADIGGTHLRLAVAQGGVAGPQTVLALDDAPDLFAALGAFLAGQAVPPRRAVIAVAGPVGAGPDGGRAVLTNRALTLDAAAIARSLGLPGGVRLVNDFAALAAGLPALRDDPTTVALGGGAGDAGAPLAVLGAGTGLGIAAWLPPGRDGPARVLATEGGHATLAAGDAREAAIVAALRPRFGGHLSAERVLSGPGLVHLHDAIHGLAGAEPPARTPAEVVDLAERHACVHCTEALATFCALLGSLAGDLALLYGARGGVLVAGGVPPRFAAALAASAFRARFEAKGRFRDWLAPVPTWLVTRPDAAMPGLAALAAGGG